MDMEFKFCKHCDEEHPLTKEFWFKCGNGWQCKTYQKYRRRINYKKRKEHYDNYNKEYKKANPEWHKRIRKEHYQRNADKIKKRNREYTKKKMQECPSYKLAITLRGRMYRAIKGNYKTGSAVKDLGCSVKELKVYLEAQFQEGMSWDNHGKYGWHIDHIKPLSSFDLEDPEQFKQAVHYTNLQPLWARDNLSKNNKIKD